MQSPGFRQRVTQGETAVEAVVEGVISEPTRSSKPNSPKERDLSTRNTKSPMHSGIPAHSDSSATLENPASKQNRMANGSTSRFNINLSSENDRLALTRYTNQTLTSLAAYRDALIDENGRLNAMLMKAQAGLEVLADIAEIERLEGEGIARVEHESRLNRTTSVMDIVRASMVEELRQLRSKAAQLREEERTTSESMGARSEFASAQRDLGAGQASVPTEDPTMMVYYTMVNKLQSDLETSKKGRDEAKNALGSMCRQKPAQPVNRSRTAEGLTSSIGQRVFHGKHGHHVGNSAQRGASRGPVDLKEIMKEAFQTEMVEVAQDGSLLPLLTDQEEAVWLRERRESEMERALRDMRCYVETMIREWREVRDIATIHSSVSSSPFATLGRQSTATWKIPDSFVSGSQSPVYPHTNLP